MKKFLYEELKSINKLLKNNSDNDNLLKTRQEIMDLLENNEIDYTYLSNFNMSDKYDFIKEIVDQSSKMKLLDTESPIDYPSLITRTKINSEDILKFLNNLYSDEVPDDLKAYYSINNIKVYKNSFFNRIAGKGKCIVYNNYYTFESTILLDKYSNIKDFIIPAQKAIETIPEIVSNSFNTPQKLYLMKKYLEYRAVSKLKNTQYRKDSIIYDLIQYDNFILNARLAKKLILKYPYEELDNEQKMYLVDLYLDILGQILANKDNVTLYDIYRTPFINDLTSYSEKLAVTENDMVNRIKVLSNKTKNYID